MGLDFPIMKDQSSHTTLCTGLSPNPQERGAVTTGSRCQEYWRHAFSLNDWSWDVATDHICRNSFLNSFNTSNKSHRCFSHARTLRWPMSWHSSSRLTHLAAIRPSSSKQRHTSLGCLWRTERQDRSGHVYDTRGYKAAQWWTGLLLTLSSLLLPGNQLVFILTLTKPAYPTEDFTLLKSQSRGQKSLSNSLPQSH